MWKRSASVKKISAGMFGSVAAILLVAGIVTYINRPITQDDQTVSTIVTNPDSYSGVQLSLSGKIDSVIGSRAFTIDNPGLAGGELLVISATPLEAIGGSGIDQRIIDRDDQVRISGRVQRFSLQQIEAQLGTDLVDETFADWEGKPVIIADEVEKNL